MGGDREEAMTEEGTGVVARVPGTGTEAPETAAAAVEDAENDEGKNFFGFPVTLPEGEGYMK